MKLTTIFVLLLLARALPAQVNVLTANYGNDRTNANLSEKTLSASNVNLASFGKVFALPVDGFMYAQPLYVRQLDIPDRGTRNVVFAATMHNSVYAFDADSPQAPLWEVNLGPSVPSTDYHFTDILPEVGILSTPVIDLEAGAIYAVANTFTEGRHSYVLHALDLATGAERFGGPVVIAGSVPGTGLGSVGGVLGFDPFQHLQRPALLLLNGVVYAAFGSHADQQPYHGWIFGYDAKDLTRQVAAFSVTPDGSAGSIWQSGRGMAADDAGYIYAVTANGDYDGLTNWGESVLKLDAALSVLDWFTPDNWQDLNDRDDDLGSCGPILIPGTDLLVTGSKRGAVYLLDRRNLGRLVPGNTQIPQTFQAVSFGIFSNLVLWNRPDGPILYTRGIDDFVKAFRLVNGLFSPLPQASVYGEVPYDGLALSADGSRSGTGILWMIMEDYHAHPAPGALYAFDAEDIRRELWNSAMNPARDRLGQYAKFATPTIANGRVYVPTFSKELAVYGLLAAGPRIDGIASAASNASGGVAPGELVSIFGAGFGPSEAAYLTLDDAGRVSTQLGGMRALFDGVPAPVYFAWTGQLRAVAPFDVAGRSETLVQVEQNGQVVASYRSPVVSAAPGLFTMSSVGLGQGAILNQDHTLNTPQNPAFRGSIVVLFATGGGQTDPPGQNGVLTPIPPPGLLQDVSVTIDGLPAEIMYSGGAPTLVSGVIQVNARVPAEARKGDDVPIGLTIGGQSSQPGVTLVVR
jgi:uncharacterized protein (TIGR03437 family)